MVIKYSAEHGIPARVRCSSIFEASRSTLPEPNAGEATVLAEEGTPDELLSVRLMVGIPG